MKQIEKKADIARREPPEGLIEGRNAVLEALRSGRTIDHVFLAEGDTDRALSRLAGMAREAGAVVKTADRRKLDAMSPTGAHQGVIAFAGVLGICVALLLLFIVIAIL